LKFRFLSKSVGKLRAEISKGSVPYKARRAPIFHQPFVRPGMRIGGSEKN